MISERFSEIKKSDFGSVTNALILSFCSVKESEIYFIRHGQASFGSENYDNLSELGHKQSKLLGLYLTKIGIDFDRIVSGTLNRQQQTCQNIIKAMEISPTPEKQSLLNEYDVKDVLSCFVGKRNLTHE